MAWYVLQVMTGHEKDVCKELRRKGVMARVPTQQMEIRRRGQWYTEERLLLPGYLFVSVEYSAALYHIVSPVSGVIRWLGLENGHPQSLDVKDVLRWQLDSSDTLGMSRVLFHQDGSWTVVDGPLLDFETEIKRVDRRQRRAFVITRLGGALKQISFGVIPAEGSV